MEGQFSSAIFRRPGALYCTKTDLLGSSYKIGVEEFDRALQSWHVDLDELAPRHVEPGYTLAPRIIFRRTLGRDEFRAHVEELLTSSNLGSRVVLGCSS